MTFPMTTTEEALRLSRAMVECYCECEQDLTFGQWVFATCYPELVAELLPSGRDFCGAQRTNDGKSYLGGMLMSGSLPAEPVRQFLGSQGSDSRRISKRGEATDISKMVNSSVSRSWLAQSSAHR